LPGLVEAAQELCRAASDFDVGRWAPTDCFALAEVLAVAEKACAAVRMLAAARASEANIPRQAGYRDGSHWLALRTGSTTTQARQELDTAGRLSACPATQAALQSGSISIAQAAEIARSEAEDPGVESTLVDVARLGDLAELRSEARRVRQRRVTPDELRRRHWAARGVRLWQDSDGMVRLQGALPPELGVPLGQRIDREAQRRYRAAKRSGEALEPFEAYAADALVGLVRPAGGSGGSRPGPDGAAPQLMGEPVTVPSAGCRSDDGASGEEVDSESPQPADRRGSFEADLVIVCDLLAWRRGRTEPGEVCHIIGGGPIPVEVARGWADDAFVKAVLHDGTRISTVHHFGRHLPAVLRTALDLGPVPEFTGRSCRECGRPFHLEHDHIVPLARNGPTSYDNLQALCWPCHRAKTERDCRNGWPGEDTRPSGHGASNPIGPGPSGPGPSGPGPSGPGPSGPGPSGPGDHNGLGPTQPPGARPGRPASGLGSDPP
jgi:hypothetical protein